MSSSDYWRKRESEALKARLKDESAYEKEIERILNNTRDAVQKEINSFYARYANSEGITLSEAKKRVSKADIEAYARKAEKYVKEREFSKQANEEMRLYNATMKINRLEMLKANIGLELISGTEEINKLMNDVLYQRTTDEYKRQAGILGKTIQNNEKKAKYITNASFHNATFSERIWSDQALLRDKIGKQLQAGLIQGKNPRVMARDIKKVFNTSTYNAERLMRTELARVQIDAQKDSFEANGFTQYTFITNTGCCSICAALDGKHFDVKKMMSGENAPPMHPNCRCSVAAYEDDDEYEAWLDFLDKGGTTEEWKNLKKEFEKSSNDDTIKSIRKSVKIPQDCVHLLKADTNFDDKNIDVAVLKAINRAIEVRKSYSNDFVFDEIKIARFADGDMSIFITNYEVFGGRSKTQLYLNRDYFIGKTEDDINKICSNKYESGWWKSKKIDDLVNHEIMHAKINHSNSYEKVESLYDLLKSDDRVRGFCGLVDKYPDEFLNEMYVAICNGETIDQKYIDVYNEYIKNYLGG